MVDAQVVYRALTCCLPGMRVMLLEARSRLTKTKKPGQVILLIVIIVSIIVIIVIILLILMMKTLATNQNNNKTMTAPHHHHHYQDIKVASIEMILK